MSTLKVNAIKRYTGTTITIGESGDTITITAGATLGGVGSSLTALNATELTSGTLPDARFPATLPALSGGNLTALNATNLGSGTLPDARFPATLPAVSGANLTNLPVETKPTISSISPATIENTATTVTITGTNYQNAPYVDAIGSTGVIYPADTVTYNSATEVEAAFTLAIDGTYYIRIENPDGNAVRSSTALMTVSDAPVWTTGSGTLGSFTGGTTGAITSVAATGDTVVISETTDVLTNSAQGNCQLASGGAISSTGGFPNSSYTSETTFNFTLRATDAQGQTADRNFSMTATYMMSNSVRLDG